MQSSDLDAYLTRHIPYRMHAVGWFLHVLRFTEHWSEPRPMEIYLEGKRCIIGNHFGIANPSIEIGIIHCRVLLEFLGLCCVDGKLATVKKRRDGDVGIEMFSRGDGSPLSRLSRQQAIDAYAGAAEEAESSILVMIEHAHKAVAHLTEGPIQDEHTLGKLKLSAEGVLKLTCRFLYDELGYPHPKYETKYSPNPA